MGVANSKKIVRDIFLGFVRVHLLHHAAEQRIFGVEMIAELRRHGYNIGPGTLYPMLHSLQQDGYLRCDQEVTNGRMRKYYRITPKGRRLLAQVKERARELVAEVLAE